jgi:hypothetical protein
MSSRHDDDHQYKVVYSDHRQDAYQDRPVRRVRREAEYDDDRHMYGRDYRDERFEVDRRSRNHEYREDRLESDVRSRISDSRSVTAGTTRTRYQVGRDRDAEAYVKRTDAIVVEAPRYCDRSTYEIIRPERGVDGSYVIDLGRSGGHPKDFMIDVAPRRHDRDSRYDDLVYSRAERTLYDPRDRSTANREISYMDVRNIEVAEDDRYSRRGRAASVYADEEPPRPRLKSAMRGEVGSPSRMRTQRSVGFFREDISHHDAGESRHERPGAEAHLAGRYLVGNETSEDDRYAQDARRRSRSRTGYGSQRSDPRLHEYDEEDIDRRTFTEETMRSYEYDDERTAYPPQRDHSRRRHHRHHKRDEDRYSVYDDEVTKKTTTKEYY